MKYPLIVLQCCFLTKVVAHLRSFRSLNETNDPIPLPPLPPPPPSHPQSNTPSILPSYTPSSLPTLAPSAAPSPSPSTNPSLIPSLTPSSSPSFFPSISPTQSPSSLPTNPPTSTPTFIPSYSPSLNPTYIPTYIPSPVPTSIPTIIPSWNPSYPPNPAVSTVPSWFSSSTPSNAPSEVPTEPPTESPILNPPDAPPKPKPKPQPQPLPSEPIKSPEVFESQVYALDGIPFQKFGHTSAISENFLAVGTDDSTSNPAKVYLYQIIPVKVPDPSYRQWSQQTIFEDSVAVASSGFGKSLALTPDHLIVGAPYDSTYNYLAGRVHIFTLDSSLAPVLLDSPQSQSAGAQFGASLAISENRIAVGAPGDSTTQLFAGAVYLYEFNETGNTWNRIAVLMVDLPDSKYNRLGSQVAFIDSTTIATSAVGYSKLANNGGAVFIFHKTVADTGSDTGMYDIQQVLSPTTDHPDSYFGSTIAFSDKFALITASTELQSGIVYSYERKVTFDGASTWVPQQIIQSGDLENHYDQFGQSIQIYTLSEADQSAQLKNLSKLQIPIYGIAAIGAPGDNSLGLNSGAVYLFAALHVSLASKISSRTPNVTTEYVWINLAKITNGDSKAYFSYGKSVSLAKGILAVGADLADSPVTEHAGVVYLENDILQYYVQKSIVDKIVGNVSISGTGGSGAGGGNGGESGDDSSDSNSNDSNYKGWSKVFTSVSIVAMAFFPAAIFAIFFVMVYKRQEKKSIPPFSKLLDQKSDDILEQGINDVKQFDTVVQLNSSEIKDDKNGDEVKQSESRKTRWEINPMLKKAATTSTIPKNSNEIHDLRMQVIGETVESLQAQSLRDSLSFRSPVTHLAENQQLVASPARPESTAVAAGTHPSGYLSFRAITSGMTFYSTVPSSDAVKQNDTSEEDKCSAKSSPATIALEQHPKNANSSTEPRNLLNFSGRRRTHRYSKIETIPLQKKQTTVVQDL